MRKLSFVSALASAAVLAAVAASPVSAASLTTNVSPHISMTRPMYNVGSNNIGASNQYFTPNTPHTAYQGPKQRRWVCGPIVNWDGSLHCHWVP